MCHFDNLVKLISLDNDCLLYFIFVVNKPCFIHIKLVRKVMSLLVKYLWYSNLEVSFSVAPSPFRPRPTFPEICIVPPPPVLLHPPPC